MPNSLRQKRLKKSLVFLNKSLAEQHQNALLYQITIHHYPLLTQYKMSTYTYCCRSRRPGLCFAHLNLLKATEHAANNFALFTSAIKFACSI